MNGLDYAILILMAVSMGMGLVRGLAREIISLLVWVAALWLGFVYGAQVGGWLSRFITTSALQVAAGFAIIVIAILIIGTVAGYWLTGLIHSVGLGTVDRILGTVFGLARGVILLGVCIILVKFTPLVDTHGWRSSVIIPHIEPWLTHVQDWISVKWHHRAPGTSI